MAENQYVNKVTYGTKEDGTENVLIDLSQDTVDSAHLVEGYTVHDKTGAIISGTMLNNGAVTATIDGLTVTSYTIPQGYHGNGGSVSLTDDIETALSAL